MIGIVLIDDHQLILAGIMQMLADQNDIAILATFTNASDAVTYILENEVDIVVSDLDMPEMSGIEMIKKIRKEKNHQKIIVLSMLDEQSIVNRMIRYDVNGYLMKNAAQSELVIAIEKVHSGEKYYNEDIRLLLFREMEAKPRQRSNQKIPRLSMREKEVLKLIIAEMTAAEIAKKLFISEGTVITHRKHILSKLGAKNTAGIVRISLELGLVDI